MEKVFLGIKYIMAKIISIFNHKGGVGKTTLTYNLSWALAEAGKKVLMLDADAQQNLSILVRGNQEEIIELSTLENIETSNFWDTYLNIHDVFSHYLYVGVPEVDKPIFCKQHQNLKNDHGSGKLDLLLGSLDIELSDPNKPASDDFLRMQLWEESYNAIANSLLALP